MKNKKLIKFYFNNFNTMETLLFFYNLLNTSTPINQCINTIFSFLNIQLNDDIKEKFFNNNSSYNLHITFNKTNIEEELTKINFNDINFNEQTININLENNRIFCDIVLISNNIYKHTEKLDTILKKYNDNYDVQIIERISAYTDYYSKKCHIHNKNPNYYLFEGINTSQNIKDFDEFILVYLDDNDEFNLQSLLIQFHEKVITNKIGKIKIEINDIQNNKNTLISEINRLNSNLQNFKNDAIDKIKNFNTKEYNKIKEKLIINNSKYENNNDLKAYENLIRGINKNELKPEMHYYIINSFRYETVHLLNLRNKYLNEYIKLYNIKDVYDGIISYETHVANKIKEINADEKDCIPDEKNKHNSTAYIELYEHVINETYRIININTQNILTKIKNYMDDELIQVGVETLYKKKLLREYNFDYNQLNNGINEKQKLLDTFKQKIVNLQQTIDILFKLYSIFDPEENIIGKKTTIIHNDDNEDDTQKRKLIKLTDA